MNENNNLDQLFMLATQEHQNNQFFQAENLYRLILNDFPNHYDTLHLLGIVCSQQGKYEEAEKYLHQAIRLAPQNPVFHNNLGETLRRKGNLKEAIQYYQKALSIHPDFAEAHYNLGNVLKATGDLNGAIEHYQKTFQINPNHSQAYYNLGNTFMEQGRFKSAMENYQHALQINPNSAEAHNNLGITLREFDRLDEALNQYQLALNLKPDFMEAHRNLAIAYEALGNMEEAKKHYQKILATDPENQLLNLQVESLCSIIPFSNLEIDNFRQNLMQSLDKLSKNELKIDLSKLNESGGQPPSLLIYQGRDDQPLKIKYASLFAEKFPVGNGRDRSLIQNRKPHIGFVVTNGHEGVFIKCMRGILNNLSSEQFRLTVVCSLPNGEKIIRPAIYNPAVEYLNLPPNFERAVETVRKANFDILYYWEVGTDITNYFMPFFGLAPVQCTSWGWPVTTGIPQMNYFLSSESLEVPESDTHYTEKLIRLKRLPVYYYRPPVPEILKPKDHFGLSEQEHIYLCSQNLRKVHPDFDNLAAEILRHDQQGILLFIEDKQENITKLLKNRLQATHPDVMARIRFMKRVPEEEYLNLIVHTDVILDTLYYTGGANTTYDAFACGTPVVTLPANFHRGRYTYAAYQQINVLDCIASSEEDYINKAVKLGTDSEYRNIIKAKITANCPVLFEDMTAVEEMAEFFQKALKKTALL